jgi:hypothetical protein
MDQGNLDGQIILDFETFVLKKKILQTEHLDKSVKGVSHHYEQWTKDNQDAIKYAERILECIKKQSEK